MALLFFFCAACDTYPILTGVLLAVLSVPESGFFATVSK
jgi:hypothetical protein